MTIYDENEIIAGLPLWLWIRTFLNCHNLMSNGVFFIGWPDGKSFLEQEAIVIETFEIMKDQLNRMANK